MAHLAVGVGGAEVVAGSFDTGLASAVATELRTGTGFGSVIS